MLAQPSNMLVQPSVVCKPLKRCAPYCWGIALASCDTVLYHTMFRGTQWCFMLRQHSYVQHAKGLSMDMPAVGVFCLPS